ncbi:MAG: methylenetetrahydrofolate reductase [Pontimonas sp.]
MRFTVNVSFEVYPPRSQENLPQLHDSIRALDTASPEFISVTFGAGGSSTRDSLDVLTFIKDNTSARPLAHLTCVGTTSQEASELISSFVGQGITEFLALRGDLPAGEVMHRGELHHAIDLVNLMKSDRNHSQAIDRIAVAAFPNGHPESQSLDEDIETLLAKQNAGATLAITQLFFYAEEYAGFVDKATKAGVTIPIVPGLMPVTSPGRLARVLELTGEEEPHQLSQQLRSTDNPEEWKFLGIEWCARMIRELVDAQAPGIHLYAFNQHETVLSALEQAGVR